MLPRTKTWGILVAASVLGQSAAAANDWPVFRGNASQTAVAESDLPESLVLKWTFQSKDAIEGSPTIYEQTVYFGSFDGKLYAVDLASGKKKWDYQAKAIKVAPAVRAGAVYFGDVSGVFHCVDAATGKKRWTVATEDDIVSPANFAGDKIVFGSDDHHLYCVSADGKIIWRCKTKEKVRAAPTVAEDRILFGGCDQLLHVVDLATGKEVTTVPLGGHVGASAAVSGNQAYVGNMANHFLAMDWKKATLLWKFEAKRGGQPFFSSPAVTEELVIAGSRDKRVRAWQRSDGKEVWTFPTEGRVDSSPVVAGRRVLVGSFDGHLYVLDLARGVELARFNLGPIPSSPAVADQCVVVATFEGTIHCLGAKK